MGRIYDETWGRGFSALYDRCFKAAEEAGLREMRRTVLARAQGRVLEVGAGTGLNLELYPTVGIESLTLSEPDPLMVKRLREKLGESEREAELIRASADDLPFADDSFDTVTVTLVLCTVSDQPAALREIQRVLRPGGQLLFLEHVRSRHPDLARWQDRLERPWRFLGDGCHCNRDTVAAISASRFEIEEIEHDRLPKAPAIVRPLVRGSAILSS
jgi:ubiquinone/menaquinone biosynthesis C-methylase UbiE